MKIKIILLFLFLFCLVGCVASKSSLVSYANSRYGNAKLISYSKSNDSSYAIFLDKDYNFEYRVNSYMSSIYFDGSYFGSVPSKSDNYGEMFVSYLKENLGNELSIIEKNCDCSIEWNFNFYNDSYLIIVYFNNSDIKDCMIKIGDLVSSYDKKDSLDNKSVLAYYNDELFGKYVISSKKFLNFEDLEIDQAREELYISLYNNKKKVVMDDISFLKVDVLDAHDIPGIDAHSIKYNVGITDETLKNTKVYYFNYNGEIWIVADCFVDNSEVYIYRIS